MGMISGINYVSGSIAPLTTQAFNDPFHRFRVIIGRTEVPSFGVFCPVFVETLSQLKIS
jgi:hypothetical protein